MNELFMDFLTILLPTYFFLYMAITLIHRNTKSLLNRIAAFLMLAFLFYFIGEYVKTSLLPNYQMQIVLYGNSPMLLFVICFLVHLCMLMGEPITSSLKRWLPLIYAAPFTLWAVFLATKDHQVLYNASVTEGRSPLDPLFLLLALIFVTGYILLSVIILAVSCYRTPEIRLKKILGSLLLSLFGLFAWFIVVTALLQSKVLTSRNAMILYFIGYLLWAVALRHFIGKHNIMPDYRKLFHILFKSAPIAILLLDGKGAVREMNPRAKQWFEGIAEEEIPRHFDSKDGLSLAELLRSFQQEREDYTQWEVSIHNPNKRDLDLIMGLDVLQEANEELFVMHLTDVTSLKDTERRLLESEGRYKHFAHHDALTELYNRAAIQEQLQEKLAGHEPFAVVLVDLDHFKPINDTYGHLVGDLYLEHIANMFKVHAQPEDLIGRLGGDEFVIAFAYTDDSDIHQMVDHRLSPLYDNPFVYEGTRIPISFSAGVSVYPKDGQDINTLLKKADEAMYRVKRSGQNRSSYFMTY
ncbi:putative diguanylate cyclase YegE [compost metagenome]